MMASTVFVGTWGNGLFVVSADGRNQEFTNQSVRALAPDGQGGLIAIVDQSIQRRAPDGTWTMIAAVNSDIACCVKVDDAIYVGTDDARILRVSVAGEIEQLSGFDQVAGRDTWYAGSAILNGKRVGPPLGVRSICATCDGAVLLANVHVGGIPRSVDGGLTWQPTIEIDSDVHEVCAYPKRDGVVAAASAAGLCTSSDGGATWVVEKVAPHALPCYAVQFVGDDVLVSAAVDPFAPEGALYRRGFDEDCPLRKVTGGLPEWLGGKVDTGCIATFDTSVAIADMQGNVYVSADTGRSWSLRAHGMPTPSSLLIL